MQHWSEERSQGDYGRTTDRSAAFEYRASS